MHVVASTGAGTGTTGQAVAGQFFQLTCQLDGISMFILHVLSFSGCL